MALRRLTNTPEQTAQQQKNNKIKKEIQRVLAARTTHSSTLLHYSRGGRRTDDAVPRRMRFQFTGKKEKEIWRFVVAQRRPIFLLKWLSRRAKEKGMGKGSDLATLRPWGKWKNTHFTHFPHKNAHCRRRLLEWMMRMARLMWCPREGAAPSLIVFLRSCSGQSAASYTGPARLLLLLLRLRCCYGCYSCALTKADFSRYVALFFIRSLANFSTL